jgi:ArsR family transcriptional regulator, cadmium/lead-responsive transcriptional repressor
MTEEPPCCPPESPSPRWIHLRNYVRALRFPTRWMIIDLIGEGSKSTKDIHEHLNNCGEELSMSGLYYHLSELKNADIIEVAQYLEKGGGAPEKVWKLKTKKIVIDLLETEKNTS